MINDVAIKVNLRKLFNVLVKFLTPFYKLDISQLEPNEAPTGQLSICYMWKPINIWATFLSPF